MGRKISTPNKEHKDIQNGGLDFHFITGLFVLFFPDDRIQKSVQFCAVVQNPRQIGTLGDEKKQKVFFLPLRDAGRMTGKDLI